MKKDSAMPTRVPSGGLFVEFHSTNLNLDLVF
jgi:hypothetical protein